MDSLKRDKAQSDSRLADLLKNVETLTLQAHSGGQDRYNCLHLLNMELLFVLFFSNNVCSFNENCVHYVHICEVNKMLTNCLCFSYQEQIAAAGV
jgi:hypothetical protein